MTKKIQNKGVRNAHILLGAYWVSKVLGGGNPLKATIDVLDMERRTVINEARREKANKQADDERGLCSRKTAKAASQTAGRTGRKSASGSLLRAAAGIVRHRVFKKAAVSVLKSSKVI